MANHGRVCPNCQSTLQHPSATFELYRRPAPGVEAKGAPLPVLTYLCPQCGYLQLYASRVAGSLYGQVSLESQY